MQTLEKALANLIKDGSISRNEGLAKASKPGELERLITER
jgi:twitching motility protein PilT